MIMVLKEPSRWSDAVADAEVSAAKSCELISRFVRGFEDGVSMRTAMLWTKYPAKDQNPQLQAAVDAYTSLDALLPLNAARALAFTRDGLNNWFRTAGNDAARIMLAEAVRFGLVRVRGYVGHAVVEMDYRQLSAAQVDLEQDRIMFAGTWFELVTLWPGSGAPPVPTPNPRPSPGRDATDSEINTEIKAVLDNQGKDDKGHKKGYRLGDYDRQAECQVLEVMISKEKVYKQVVSRFQNDGRGLRMPYAFNTFKLYTKPASGHEINKPFGPYRFVYKADVETRAKPGKSKKKV